jgi:hypothetical protein
MPENENKIIKFEQLNLLGKTVFIAGAAVKLTSTLIDFALDRTARLIAETEKAFLEGKDPNVDDAKILEERIERP